jgi:hypothetical protein
MSTFQKTPTNLRWKSNSWPKSNDARQHSEFAIANNNRITTLLKPKFYQGIKAKGMENHS